MTAVKVLERMQALRGPRPVERGRSLRLVGRVVLWAAVGLVLVRGVGAVVGEGTETTAAPMPTVAAVTSSPQEALATGFAVEWLSVTPGWSERRSRALAAYLAPSVDVGTVADVGTPTTTQRVVSAIPANTVRLDDHHALVTIAAVVGDGRGTVRRYVTVPVFADGVTAAVFGPPALAEAPAVGDVDVAAGSPPSDEAAGEIRTLVDEFMPAYLGGGGPEKVAFFTAPGVTLRPVTPRLRPVQVRSVDQLGADGTTRVLRVAVTATDPRTGAIVALEYRLTIRQGTDGRWLVVAVNAGGPPGTPVG